MGEAVVQVSASRTQLDGALHNIREQHAGMRTCGGHAGFLRDIAGRLGPIAVLDEQGRIVGHMEAPIVKPENRKLILDTLHEKRQFLDNQRRYYSQGVGADHPEVARIMEQQKLLSECVTEIEALPS
jgi:hypothetical protein